MRSKEWFLCASRNRSFLCAVVVAGVATGAAREATVRIPKFLCDAHFRGPLVSFALLDKLLELGTLLNDLVVFELKLPQQRLLVRYYLEVDGFFKRIDPGLIWLWTSRSFALASLRSFRQCETVLYMRLIFLSVFAASLARASTQKSIKHAKKLSVYCMRVL